MVNNLRSFERSELKRNSISSLVKISMISLISSLPLKFANVSSKLLLVYLESFRQSSLIFGNLRYSSEMFGKRSAFV